MSSSFLKRYTDFPALIYLLNERKITLLDPQLWEDRNDAGYLTIYKEKRKLASVLALCFTQSLETYHHWRVFANGPAGVCIHFNRKKLLDSIKKISAIRTGNIKYLKIGEVKDSQLNVKDLPYCKRFAFQHENEYRIIYESKNKELSFLDIPIPITSIEKIILSPWVNTRITKHLDCLIRSIDHCNGIKVVHSSLINNQVWLEHGRTAR